MSGRHDAIKRRFNGILPSSLVDPLLTHAVGEEKGEVTGRGKEPPQGWIWVQSGNGGYSQGLA